MPKITINARHVIGVKFICLEYFIGVLVTEGKLCLHFFKVK